MITVTLIFLLTFFGGFYVGYYQATGRAPWERR